MTSQYPVFLEHSPVTSYSSHCTVEKPKDGLYYTKQIDAKSPLALV